MKWVKIWIYLTIRNIFEYDPLCLLGLKCNDIQSAETRVHNYLIK